MTLHSIFGSAPPPGDYNAFSEPSGITLGMTFYHVGLEAGSKIAGGRLWVPAGFGPGTATIELRLGVKTGTNNLDSAPVQSKTVSWTTDGKWVEALFDVPQDAPAPGSRWMVSYRLGPGTAYIATLNLRSVGTAIPAVDGSPFVLGEYSSTTPPNGPVRDRYFMIGANAPDQPNAEQGGYGIDTIVDIPDDTPPENVAPTANAGVDRSVFVGQEVTLSAGATDSDGTIASYLWTQISGPAVVLGGAGAIRTFTPTQTGPYVFALEVTDDDGATSEPDAVTITVKPVPVDTPPNVIKTFPSIEKAVLALFDRDLALLDGHPERAGGDLPKSVSTVYIQVSRVPGGSSTQTGGQFIIDIDCYARSYDDADSAASDTEALLLSYPHTVEVGGRSVTLDSVEQNIGPSERPWEDDAVTRIGATYVITARRR